MKFTPVLAAFTLVVIDSATADYMKCLSVQEEGQSRYCWFSDGYCCEETWHKLNETEGTNKFSGIPAYLNQTLMEGEIDKATYDAKLQYFQQLSSARLRIKK